MTYHDPMSKFTKQSIYWPCLFVLSKTKQTNKKFIHWTLTLWMFEIFQLKLKLFFYLIIIKSNEYNSLLMWLSLSQILAKFKILHQAMHHAVQIVRIKEIFVSFAFIIQQIDKSLRWTSNYSVYHLKKIFIFIVEKEDIWMPN